MEFSSGLMTVAVLVLTIYAIQRLRGKKKKKLPPVAGTIFHQLINFRRLHDYQTELCRKYKTFRMLAPFNHQIYIVDPANVEYILKTNFKNYGKGSYSHECFEELLGDGIFAVDGEKWRHQRNLASYEFSTKVLRDFSSGVFKINATKLAQIVSNKANSNEAMDLQELFMKTTMDSIFKVGFGTELNSLQGSEDVNRFTEAFDSSSVLITRRYVDPFWKIEKYFRIGHEAALPGHIKILDDFVYNVIDAKIKSSSKKGSKISEKKDDLLSRFLSEMEKDPENRTRKYLRDIILNFVIAGKYSSAGTLSWFIYMLCKNPLIQDKVAKEIKEAVETDDNINLENFTTLLTEDALDKMQYLHATLAETLRLYPSVPLDPKVCFKDDTLPDGFNTCKGDLVFYQPYAMGRMKYLWGEDAEVFRPERWINVDGLFQPENSFKFTAFQAGPRICIGKEFAYKQMKIISAVLLHFFKFKLKRENEDINYRTMITLQIDQGLHVYAHIR